MHMPRRGEIPGDLRVEDSGGGGGEGGVEGVHAHWGAQAVIPKARLLGSLIGE